MDTRARRFSRSKESRDIGLPQQVRANPAHGVVSGWPHGSKGRCKIDRVLETGLIHPGKPAAGESSGQMSKIEKSTFVVVGAHLGYDGTRNDVPGRQLC